MVACSGHVLEVWLALLCLEDGLPPGEVVDLDTAAELAVVLDKLLVFHELVHPFEGVVVVLDRHTAIHLGAHFLHDDVPDVVEGSEDTAANTHSI